MADKEDANSHAVNDYRLEQVEKAVALGFEKVDRKLDDISANRPSKADIDNMITLKLVTVNAELDRLKSEKDSRDKWNNRLFAILSTVVAGLLVTVIGNLLVNGAQQ